MDNNQINNLVYDNYIIQKTIEEPRCLSIPHAISGVGFDIRYAPSMVLDDAVCSIVD